MPQMARNTGKRQRRRAGRFLAWATLPVVLVAFVIARSTRSGPLPVLPIPTFAVPPAYTASLPPSATHTLTLTPFVPTRTSTPPPSPTSRPVLPTSVPPSQPPLPPPTATPLPSTSASTKVAPAATRTAAPGAKAKVTTAIQPRTATVAMPTTTSLPQAIGKQATAVGKGKAQAGARTAPPAPTAPTAPTALAVTPTRGGSDGEVTSGQVGVAVGGGAGDATGVGSGAPPSATATSTSTSTSTATETSTPTPTDIATPSPSAEASPTADRIAPVHEVEHATVVRVVDGDTIDVLLDGEKVRVRLIGVDSPDMNHPHTCGAPEAKAMAEELLAQSAGRVLLEKDVSDKDRYGRLLRYVWFDMAGDPTMLNLQMVEQGYAKAAAYPPDTHHQRHFEQAERLARAQNLGLWSTCPAWATPSPTATYPPSGDGR
jgi:endonuclease YncB( thermonuclease family)